MSLQVMFGPSWVLQKKNLQALPVLGADGASMKAECRSCYLAISIILLEERKKFIGHFSEIQLAKVAGI